MDISNMPFGEKVQCYLCQKEESLMWHQSEEGVKCNECQEAVPSTENTVDASGDQEPNPSDETKPDETKSGKTTKNTRSYKTRQNSTSAPKQVATKTKSRRSAVFKSQEPHKSPSARATIVTLQNCFHKGQLFTVGDIVSALGTNGLVYYAQITGLLQDEYCEKSCSITWLLPTRKDHNHKFDPMYYVLGTVENLPRRLDSFTFVMHCPSDYYKVNTPYPTRHGSNWEPDFIWTRLHNSQ